MTERKFTLFHLSLVPVQQTNFDMRLGDSREEWLRFALSEPFEFLHRGGGQLYWVPHGDIEETIFGIVQRTRSHGHHLPPDKGGTEVVTEEWQGAYVLLDPTHHDEGQRVAVENDVVGRPRALLRSLVSAINDRPDAPFQIEVEALFDATEFWAFARKHNHLMRRITFDFVVPNMWGTESDLESDLDDTGKQTGAERVKISMFGQHGVTTDNPKVRNGVEYAEKGAGTVSATAPDGTRFSSTRRPKVTKIPAFSEAGQPLKGYFHALKKRILSRE